MTTMMISELIQVPKPAWCGVSNTHEHLGCPKCKKIYCEMAGAPPKYFGFSTKHSKHGPDKIVCSCHVKKQVDMKQVDTKQIGTKHENKSRNMDTIVIGQRMHRSNKVLYNGKFMNDRGPHVECDEDTVIGSTYNLGPEEIMHCGARGYAVVRMVIGLKNDSKDAHITVCWAGFLAACQHFMRIQK